MSYHISMHAENWFAHVLLTSSGLCRILFSLSYSYFLSSQKQQERQGRSLQRLSKDLYSKDTHFVLELIQNADDNSYPSNVTPSVKFLIDHAGKKQKIITVRVLIKEHWFVSCEKSNGTAHIEN